MGGGGGRYVWLSAAGEPHIEKLHLTERYRRPDLGHLAIEFTIEDPDTFIKPWVSRGLPISLPRRRSKRSSAPKTNATASTWSESDA